MSTAGTIKTVVGLTLGTAFTRSLLEFGPSTYGRTPLEQNKSNHKPNAGDIDRGARIS